MKAAMMLKRGSPTSDKVLIVKNDIPIPTLRKGEVLVKIAASAMNPVDWKMIDGSFPLQKKGMVGADAGGTVEKIHDGSFGMPVIREEERFSSSSD